MRTRGDTAKRVHPGVAWRLRRQKPLILVFCVVFAIVMALGSTLAWFTSADTRVNQIRRNSVSGDFTITLVDEFNSTPEDDGSYNKSVGAVNNGTLSGFVRLLVTPVFVIEGENGAADTLLPAEWGKHVTINDLNTTDWIDGEDGYFYYKYKLEAGESTNTFDTVAGKNHNLFNSVSLPAVTPTGYENATLKIEVKCEAVGIDKWDYRDGWWPGIWTDNTPTSGPLKDVDNALKALAE